MDMNAPFVRFHLPQEKNGYLSNWYMSPFTLDGKSYNCAEQYFMEQKALLFDRPDLAEKIMQTDRPDIMQRLTGKDNLTLDTKILSCCRQVIMYKAVKAKFEQNTDLQEKLLSTGDAVLVECANKDKDWAVGLDITDPLVEDTNAWIGQNLLGGVLMMVRSELRAAKEAK